jgi:hypothetical protein
MTRLTIGFALALPLVVLGCEGSPSGTAPTSSAPAMKTAAATATPRPTATSAAASTGTADTKPATTSAAASFPATDLPAKDLGGFTIGVPPGGKLDKTGNDKSSLETSDYKLMLKETKKDDLADMKAAIKKMPGFKAVTVDAPDGVIVEAEEKGAKQYLITRYVKAGDKTISCENALTKPPKDEAKAREAFDVCGTIKKK